VLTDDDPGDLDLTSRIADNLAAVRSRIAQAAAASHRSPDDIRLIAVSKTFGLDAIRAAIAAGQRDFGENRVQEALPKIETIDREQQEQERAGTQAAAGAGPDAITARVAAPLRWHLIGHLQSNKAKKAARPFDAIHSIDSVDLLRIVDDAARENRRSPDLLIQVDLAGEATKFGAPVDAARQILQAATSLTAARLVGLMVLPPFFEDPESARPYFRRLRELRDDLLREGTPPAMLRELSMGMSHDFEIAIAEGATLVRVGTAIFGSRNRH
jgi:pyridoxal phosphate enzyme (YggS family)